MNKRLIFQIPRPNPQAKLRIFCFPYAGGSSTSYLPWLDKFGSSVELVLVQMPGRGIRFTSKLHNSMDELMDELLVSIIPMTSVPYVFFGHSFGGKVAYELCCKLRLYHQPLPKHFFASGSAAPHLPYDRKRIHDLPEKAFLQEIKHLNGTPQEVLNNKDLWEIVLPILRSDFKLSESHVAKKVPMPFPISVLNGEDDNIESSRLKAWEELTISQFQIWQLPGDHFFLNQHTDSVIKKVSSVIAELT